MSEVQNENALSTDGQAFKLSVAIATGYMCVEVES